MSTPVSNLDELIRTLQPVLHPGVYAYSVLPHGSDLGDIPAIAVVRETEGITVIIKEGEALRRGWSVLFRAAWITLAVNSALEAVGLTAAVASALAEEGIPCNVVAGAYHDHLFVPFEDAERVMLRLHRLAEKPQ